ncbi:LytR/AlgR family response regulator transcription factor [Puia dinghuensis]|uniref:DNA-binding response regulator n=1 Tax=Puia dinghuensis TaxID=1792502 RepID=A0A8J2UEB7_9BACT|nr:LytTR family DNA-binding domain-containing protein [Puia dinghuensis]GGB03900.1 DNA-binding response regulator [Puia dinghuensis]
MKVIIIEDEIPAANRLNRMLQDLDEGIEVVTTLDSVESSVAWLRQAPADAVELIFMDIQLADGLSFSIFEQVKLLTPVIFTTAFDHYVLKAFKVNSVDYLLKPIDGAELRQAVTKFRQVHRGAELAEKIGRLMQEMSPAKYKERLLIRRGQQLHYLKTTATAHCHADGKLCYATDFNGNSFLLDNTLQELEGVLSPRQFYRVNRQLLVNIESIKKVHTFLGGRLKLELAPATPADTIVSRERVNGFKEWLGR